MKTDHLSVDADIGDDSARTDEVLAELLTGGRDREGLGIAAKE